MVLHKTIIFNIPAALVVVLVYVVVDDVEVVRDVVDDNAVEDEVLDNWVVNSAVFVDDDDDDDDVDDGVDVDTEDDDDYGVDDGGYVTLAVVDTVDGVLVVESSTVTLPTNSPSPPVISGGHIKTQTSQGDVRHSHMTQTDNSKHLVPYPYTFNIK